MTTSNIPNRVQILKEKFTANLFAITKKQFDHGFHNTIECQDKSI